MRVQVEVPGGGSVTVDDGRLAPFREVLARLPDAAPVRLAFAAAHVVLRAGYTDVSHSAERPGTPEEVAKWVDWEATLGIRRRLDALGFGIAEAMDTAQRFAVGWPVARRLIEECGALQPKNGFIAGAGVDHLEAVRSRADLVDGVVFQARTIRAAGGWPILLPLVQLAEERASEDEYVELYGEIIRRVEGPVFVHWLGEMFLPALRGYFPGKSFMRVMALDPAKVRGAKLSLLDAALELRVRRALRVHRQVVLTGDDFHFARLIRGGDPADATQIVPAVEGRVPVGSRDAGTGDFSHALLGILDGIAEPASVALDLLAHGDGERYLELMQPCEALGQWLFQAPTERYKAGLAFLAWLNGWQENPMLVNHEEHGRDARYYVHAVELASKAGAIHDARLATQRLKEWLEALRVSDVDK